MSLIHSDFKHMTLDDLLTLNAIPSETQYDHIVTEYNHKYNEHLLMAVIFNNIEIVKYLLDFGDRITIEEYHNTIIQKFPNKRILSSMEELISKYK